MSFNPDELVAPEWINSEFLKEVLEFNGDLKDVKIHGYKMSPASNIGEHFASIMFRANVTYSTSGMHKQDTSIIIKTTPVLEGIKKDIATSEEGLDLFATEIYMFAKVLHKCAKILSNAGYTDPLAAKLIYHSVKPRKVLVFEDLKARGYFMFPRDVPDDHEAKLIFTKLGQLHAASLILDAEGSTNVKLRGTFFSVPNCESFPSFKQGVEFLTETLQTLPGFEVAVEKLKRISYKNMAKICKKLVTTPSMYNVLDHGDYHIKNLMFSGKDPNNISNVIMVDFQACHWGSPAYDLYYIASAIPVSRRERLFKQYFETFTDVLAKLGYAGNRPTYEQLQQELKTFRALDFFFLTSISPFNCLDKEYVNGSNKDLTIEVARAFEDKNVFRMLFQTPRYISHVKGMIPIFMAEGVLDNLMD